MIHSYIINACGFANITSVRDHAERATQWSMTTRIGLSLFSFCRWYSTAYSHTEPRWRNAASGRGMLFTVCTYPASHVLSQMSLSNIAADCHWQWMSPHSVVSRHQCVTAVSTCQNTRQISATNANDAQCHSHESDNHMIRWQWAHSNLQTVNLETRQLADWIWFVV